MATKLVDDQEKMNVTESAMTSSDTSLTDNSNNPVQLFVDTVRDSQRHLVAAAVARGSSMFAMYPVDTIKTRMQMGQLDPMRLDGIFSGVVGSLVGQIPYGVLTFGSYEVYKTLLMQQFATKNTEKSQSELQQSESSRSLTMHVNPVLVYALAAVLGDLTGSLWLCPSEVVKQQMQAGMHETTWDALQAIFAAKGLAGFYQGYSGAIFRDVPFRVLQLTTFEVTKSWTLQWQQQQQQQQQDEMKSNAKADNRGNGRELSPAESAACGAVAGTFAATLTSPLDRIKTLLMTNPDAYGGSVFVCAATIWDQQGWQGLFLQGLAPRVLYIAPLVVLFFVVYEQTQQQLKQRGWGKTTS